MQLPTGMLLLLAAMLALTSCAFAQDPNPQETVGKRPYEMVWANRTRDDHPPLISFEQPSAWNVVAKDASATFARSREQQIWGDYVGKLTYRGTGSNPELRVLLAEPLKITQSFDTVTCWIYGNNWDYARDSTTPPVFIYALFADAEGKEFPIRLTIEAWKEWFLLHQRLTPDLIARVAKGGTFKGFLITGGTNAQDRALYFDNLAVFTEQFPALTFKPRPRRGIPMLPGASSGTNTGPGRLPFPTRPETILPDNLTRDFKTSLQMQGDIANFTYRGSDGALTYRITSETGTLGDIHARWAGRGGVIQPCVGGGVYWEDHNNPVPPDKTERVSVKRDGDTLVACWRLHFGSLTQEVTYTYRLWGKSLVVDVAAPGGQVFQVQYGHAVGLDNPRLVTNPYYLYALGQRPAVVVSGLAAKPLFLAGNTDWYLSNASALWAVNDISDQGVTYNGGTLYAAKTDGKRNDCHERLFVTLSPRYEEVLPDIPNPKSPYMRVAGTRVWKAFGAGDFGGRLGDAAHWTENARYGMTQLVVTNHETMWRDGGESFTFRTKAAPGKGGDRGEYDFARLMQENLGLVYGPYNNFCDLAPVNQYWNPDMVSRWPDNQFQTAWMRCYAPKPTRAVEYCALLSPIIQQKFHYSAAYCDVHTAVAPWERVDYDVRVPGAGTFSGVFYPFGEIMLLQKAAWHGPVYSEGGFHSFYSGLTDGNYAQDGSADLVHQPWLVEFDLRKIHPLCCNFGMGGYDMFYGGTPPGVTLEERDAQLDRFLAATIAFGHTGWLADGPAANVLRSYYMVQQLHSRYALSTAAEIRYADTQGHLLATSAAIASGAYARSQLVTRYADGTITAVNGDPHERLVLTAYGRHINLPPNGYVGWTEDGAIDEVSADVHGHRADYAATPDYLYADGRERFTRFAKAASNRPGICRILGGGRFEIIPVEGADCGFAVGPASAVALDKDRKKLGPATVRISRGLTYVEPVAGAFSYILTRRAACAPVALTCGRDEVVAGERVIVRGAQKHEVQIPADAKAGARLWRQFEGAWIDFTVVPLADVVVSLDGGHLRLSLTSNLPRVTDVTISVADQKQSVSLTPDLPKIAIIDFDTPPRAGAEALVVELHAGNTTQRIEQSMTVMDGFQPLAQLPDKWQSGKRVRGGMEQFYLGGSGAVVETRSLSCGGVAKGALYMHPPWLKGVGYSFALYDPITLPAQAATFRAAVGKGDGSDLGDGILFKIAVVDDQGKETVIGQTTVKQHEWLPIQGDLSPWTGKTIRLKLISDVGPNDNASGDWSAWAEMRIESLRPQLYRTLD